MRVSCVIGRSILLCARRMVRGAPTIAHRSLKMACALARLDRMLSSASSSDNTHGSCSSMLALCAKPLISARQGAARSSGEKLKT